MPTKIIDIHPHIISPDTRKYPVTPLGGEQSGWSQTRPVSLEQLIAAMDDAGVNQAAIVHSSTTYGFDNSYVADAVARYPERFTGVFSVDVLAPDAADKIRYWHERKLTGLRLFTTGSTMKGQAGWLADERVLAAWEAAGERGMSIAVQMTPAAIPDLEKLLQRYPNAAIVRRRREAIVRDALAKRSGPDLLSHGGDAVSGARVRVGRRSPSPSARIAHEQ